MDQRIVTIERRHLKLRQSVDVQQAELLGLSKKLQEAILQADLVLDGSIARVRWLVYLQVWHLLDDLQNLLDRILVRLYSFEIDEVYSAEQDQRILVQKFLQLLIVRCTELTVW